MKKRIIFGLLGFTLALSFGTFIGLKNTKVSDVKAAGETINIYADINDQYSGWESQDGHNFFLNCHYFGGSTSSTWPGIAVSGTVNQYGRDIPYFTVPSDTKSIIITRLYDRNDNGSIWKRWNIKDDSNNTIGKIGNGFNFFQLKSTQTDSNTWKQGEGWGCEYSAYKAYNATLHIDGNTQNELAVNWGNYTPADPTVSGKVFENWYIDSGFNTLYTSATPTANIELYAHFLAVSGSKTIYLKTMGSNAVNVYVFEKYNGVDYALNGNWPGSANGVPSNTLNFNGAGLLKFTINYFNASNVKMVININGDSNKSADLSVTDNAYYYATDGSHYYSGVTEVTTGEAKVAFNVDAAVRDAADSSVCNISKSDATSLVNAYKALGTKTTINNATIWTWKEAVDGEKYDISFTDIIGRLEEIANKSGSNTILEFNNSSSSTTIIIVVISTISLIGLGAFFFIKRKKEN